jgi:hypothetical protein
MKRRNLILIVLLFLIPKGYSQIMTTDNQGLKRSSLLNIKKIKKPLKIYDTQDFLIGGLSFHPSQLSMYAMVGTVKRYGLYGKLKTNFNFSSSYDYEIREFESDELFLTDDKRGRISITAGGMYRINNPLSLYAGLGYGSRWLNWISTSGDVYKVVNYSYKGIEAETGAVYKYKNVFINIGVQANSFNYLELNLGMGVNF